jgi:hypothetical protein
MLKYDIFPDDKVWLECKYLPNIPNNFRRFEHWRIHHGVSSVKLPKTREEFMQLYADIMETAPDNYYHVCRLAEKIYGPFRTYQTIDIPLDDQKPDDLLDRGFDDGIKKIVESFDEVLNLYYAYRGAGI